jgi:D-alanyl-D-alanine carboxypeptidase
MKPLIFFLALGCAMLNFRFQSEPRFSKADLMGKFKPSEHPEFSLISAKFTPKRDIYLRTEALDAFKKMHFDAAKCGINLQIISATRNFDHQKRIWDDKWFKFSTIEDEHKRASNILRFSSMPGTSRHHWGTDIDINALNDNYFQNGKGEEEYEWLCKFAHEYGFYQPYTNPSNGRKGYEEEKWHWTYLPLSSIMLENYNAAITYEDLTGFSGSHTAQGLHVIKQYVNGVELPALEPENK